jgi:hypothetical protein
MSHLKMFEHACEHGKGWGVAHLSEKKQSGGGVPCTACCRVGNEKLRKSFSYGTTTSDRRRLNRGANLHDILHWRVQLNFAVTLWFLLKSGKSDEHLTRRPAYVSARTNLRCIYGSEKCFGSKLKIEK